ncbi:DUF4238 domain-containing protein [Patescibacteria group bacterium]|nr:DUF4238 domain-containing protein [Patescibacteria group bacterium]
MKKIQHHYISKTYQNNFIGKNGKIYFLDPDGRIYASNPKNMFKEGHYNTVDGSLFIEDIMSEIEGLFSSIVNSKIKKKIIITKWEKILLSIYISTLLNRVRNNREGFRNFFKELVEWGENITDKEKRILKAVPPSKGKTYSLKEIRDILENFNSDFAVGSMDASLKVSSIIYNMKWRFLVAPKDLVFISSDNPVNLRRPEAEKKYGFNALGARLGLKYKDIQLTFPLTPEIILLAGWKNSDDLKYLEIPGSWIPQLNYTTAMRADTLFASKKDVLEKILKKTLQTEKN